MQEEVENRAVTLVISATKLTGRLLKAAILKYLASRKEKKLAKARAAPETVKMPSPMESASSIKMEFPSKKSRIRGIKTMKQVRIAVIA